MAARAFIPVIGLIGGIGSGKSRLAEWVSLQRDIVIIDGDKIGHEVLRDPAVRDRIRERFGETVFTSTGEVDRGALGKTVFGADEQKRAARSDLESMMHPVMRESMAARIEAVRAAGTAEAVLLDAAVLLEAGWDELCDAVVFVDVPREVRLSRVTGNRGWSEEQFTERESSQIDLKTKQSTATRSVDNSGPVERAGSQFLQFLDAMKNSHVNH